MTEDQKKSAAIIRAALEAATPQDAIRVNELIADIGAVYERPVGDRYNNYGLMAAGGSYEYKALEPVTNAQDAVIERLAAATFGDLSKVPYSSPEEAAEKLMGHLNYKEKADKVAVSFRESEDPTHKRRRLTVVYRDEGCGIEPSQIAKTIFALGSSHKTESFWQQGAFGMGGASTYRNAQAVILITRRAPEMNPGEDRISVAVVQWAAQGKGQYASYLTTTDWNGGRNPDASPWSAPASVFPDFAPGTHLALISYGVEGYHRVRSGDERSFDMVLNTRLYRPIAPVRFTNERARGKKEYLRGLARRLEDNPSGERQSDEEEMLYTYEGKSYRLPVRYTVFPAGDKGTRRRFVAKDHALIFTSNGQVHHNWSPARLKQLTKLSKIHERIFVEVETDELPIELRTRLFTPDRSQLLANDPALQLEDQVVDFLVHWDRLNQINADLVREAITGASTGGSALDVSKKISAALKLKGFGVGGSGGNSRGHGGGGPRQRRKVDTYPDPTTLEGPDRLVVEDGKVRLITYMLNAQDDFLDSGRGTLAFECTHPDISVSSHIVPRRLRDGYVSVQLQIPEGAAEGTYSLSARLKDWYKAAGGIGAPMEYTTKLEVVDELNTPKTGGGKDKGTQGAGSGPNVAVLWQTPEEFGDGWHNGVPGGVEDIEASELASKEEYAALASLGSTKIPTVILNKDFAPFKDYVSRRAKELTEKGVEDAKDRYAVGVGFGLILLREEEEKRAAKENRASQSDDYLAAKKAVARSVLLMMPAFDALVKEAGLDE
jgi:hypothetical protein